MIDEKIEELIKRVIKEDLGELVSRELEERFKPIQKQIDIILVGQDAITEQLREDRKDIDQIKISQATSVKQTSVIIENQGREEERVSDAIKEATNEIPSTVEASVDRIFMEKSLIKRLINKLKRKGGKK
jgi:hypothetical protein